MPNQSTLKIFKITIKTEYRLRCLLSYSEYLSFSNIQNEFVFLPKENLRCIIQWGDSAYFEKYGDLDSEFFRNSKIFFIIHQDKPYLCIAHSDEFNFIEKLNEILSRENSHNWRDATMKGSHHKNQKCNVIHNNHLIIEELLRLLEPTS